MQRAFEPFYSAKSQAIGLGLSVALLAIEAGGGGIWIDGDGSEVGCGKRSASCLHDRRVYLYSTAT